MSQIFVRKDTLLSNAGPVPPFYWFIKLAPYQTHEHVRDFLSVFYAARIQNRRAQAENRLDEVDPRLARYDVLDRNTNDAGSHRARVAILLEAFADHLAQSNDRRQLEAQVSEVQRAYLLEMKEMSRQDRRY